MKAFFNKFLFLVFILIVILSSCRNDINDDIVSRDIKQINEWILDNMEALYLWNNKIPSGLYPGREPDPEKFFYKMVYKTEDKWSYITPDMDALLAELDGIPLSTGISPAFIRIEGDRIILVVEFVYPGSPAEIKGLQRGDLILTINGQNLTIDNYYDLFFQPSITVRKGILSEAGFIPQGDPITIVSKVIETNPVIHHEIMDINGIKTGYLVYTSFISGINNVFLDSLNNAFQSFKLENITELIVDLRYNRGGETDIAGALASGIAPYSVVSAGEILVKYIYNEGLSNYFKRPGTDPKHLSMNFSSNSTNLNLNKVYFLTGWKTASASELVITGLKPYMNVITIGEPTYGKYTGSWVITDSNNPPKHKWAMLPIVMKYANKDGFTDFKNGLTPDYPVEDLILDLKPFGDPADPSLMKAKELIGGLKSIAATPLKPHLPLIRVEDEITKRGSRLIMKNYDLVNHNLLPAP